MSATIGTARTVVRGGEITWLCTFCEQQVGADEGSLAVDHQVVVEVGLARDQHTKGEGESYSLEEMLASPGPARWFAFHHACDPDRDANLHDIPVSEIDSYPRVVFWAAQLGDKTWVQETDWNEVLRSLGKR